MGAILEALFENVLMFFFRLVGALVRWTFYCFRKPFKKILNDDDFANGVTGLVGVVCIIVWWLSRQ